MFKIPEWKYFKYELQQKWEELTGSHGHSGSHHSRLDQLRVLISAHPVIKIVVGSICTILVLVAIGGVLFSERQAKVYQPKKKWFYDMNTGELFKADRTALPPIDTKSGPGPDGEPAGVSANVLTYDTTGKDKSKQFVAYLTKLTVEGKDAWEDALDGDSMAGITWDTGKLIKRPEDKDWVKASSPEGLWIKRLAYKKNKQGQTPKPVRP